MTTLTHNNIKYSIYCYSSNIEVFYGEEEDREYEVIYWDTVCPDDGEFQNEYDYINDLANHYTGELPKKVYIEAIELGFGSKIADVLHTFSEN
jgi:hypothetical protein